MSDLPSVLAGLPAASPLPFALDSERCLKLRLDRAQPGFDPADAAGFGAWVDARVAAAGARYAAGGYAENRPLYGMSAVFRGDGGEPRSLHLGIDLWIAAGTAVHAVVDGVVHSSADNAAFGDYGGTVVLEHHAGGLRFYTLYGHLARRSLQQAPAGRQLPAGALLGWLGAPAENGGWPPHLHFQVLSDMQGRMGDHPGVCRPSEAAHWLAQCPDPNLLLRIAALRA